MKKVSVYLITVKMSKRSHPHALARVEGTRADARRLRDEYRREAHEEQIYDIIDYTVMEERTTGRRDLAFRDSLLTVICHP